MKLAGIEIGGTKLQVVLGDENGAVHKRHSHIIDARQGATVIRKLIEEDLGKLGPLDAIGVGFGGPVNRTDGEIWTSYHVDGWNGFNVKKWLEDRAGCFVVVDNDGNVGALGEALVGSGRQHRVVFYVTLGSGVGGGVTIGGEIYHGQLGGELEFGHIRLDRSGKTIQDICSGWAVNERIRDSSSETLAELARRYPGAEAKALLPAIEAGDAEAQEIFRGTAIDLAFGLSHVVHLFHPDTIIIGGGLSLMGEMLRSSIEKHLRLFIMDAFQPGPLVQLSQLGTDVVPVGALMLAGRELEKKK